MLQNNQSKNEIRQKSLADLQRIDQATHCEASRIIGRRLLQIIGESKNVMAFWPLPSEPDITNALMALTRAGKSLSLPVINGNSMIPYEVDSLERLKLSGNGVHEPNSKHCKPLLPSKLDLIVVPGLAFTTKGDRLGRGGGYYDRFLGQLPRATAKVAVAFELQMNPSLPTQAHDMAVDSVITELSHYSRITDG